MMPDDSTLNKKGSEAKVVGLLADAWNEFCRLPEAHDWEKVEFMLFVHGAQNLILARGRGGNDERELACLQMKMAIAGRCAFEKDLAQDEDNWLGDMTTTYCRKLDGTWEVAERVRAPRG